MEPKYIIGIDLGTTNTTVSYCSADDKNDSPEILTWDIHQIMENGKNGSSPTLASFAYLLSEEDKKQFGLDQLCLVGEYARYMASKQPLKVAVSAKSWLCNSSVDRKDNLLPSIDSVSKEEKISPFQVICQILSTISTSWNISFEDNPIYDQYVSITVPASFDPAARQLIQEAAEAIGLSKDLVLLEEPQAAFYNWLHSNKEWKEELSIEDKVLVVDIGGGTADFSLIQMTDIDGELGLERVSVGDHLLLGGDNIDLALAYQTRLDLEEIGHSLDQTQFASLLYQCRQAKEELLSNKSSEKSFPISIQKAGRKLIGGSIKASIDKDRLESLIEQGFLPIVDLETKPQASSKVGLKSIGLPYATDARITAHLANFVSSSIDTSSSFNNLKVLFNGGPTKADFFRQLLLNQITEWAGDKVHELTNTSLDSAVSRGAAFYRWSTLNEGIRVKSGLSHSYFIQVEESAPAIPGIAPRKHALCIAPKGLEEGTSVTCPAQDFSLVVGSDVSFTFYANKIDAQEDYKFAEQGHLLAIRDDQLEQLSEIETNLNSQEGASSGFVHVKIQVSFTELGTLEIYFIDSKGHQWRLDYDVRAGVKEDLQTTS